MKMYSTLYRQMKRPITIARVIFFIKARVLARVRACVEVLVKSCVLAIITAFVKAFKARVEAHTILTRALVIAHASASLHASYSIGDAYRSWKNDLFYGQITLSSIICAFRQGVRKEATLSMDGSAHLRCRTIRSECQWEDRR